MSHEKENKKTFEHTKIISIVKEQIMKNSKELTMLKGLHNEIFTQNIYIYERERDRQIQIENETKGERVLLNYFN